MTRKIITAKLLSLVVGLVFLTGLLPLSNHMLSMDAAAYQNQSPMVQGNMADSSTDTRCEAIGSCLLVCDFMVFQSVYADPVWDSEQIVYLAPILRSIYIESLAPPPKA
jgi:hypothetical protein